MPRNSSGVYTLPLPPVAPGTTITSTWANTTLDDVTAALTASLDRFGSGGMVAPFRLIDGTEALPAFAFNAETGSGLFRASTGVVGMSVLGTARQEWTSAGVAILSDLAVTGGVEVTGGMTVDGLFEVVGAVAFDSNVGVGGNFGVVGTSTFTGNVAMSNQLVVGGPVLFTNTLDVAGLASLHGGAAITGALTVGGVPVTPGAYVLKAGDAMTGPLSITTATPLAEVINGTGASGGYTGWQNSGSSQGFVGSAVALGTGWTGESPIAATELAVRGQAGIWFDIGNTPVMHINSALQVGIGGMPQQIGLTLRNDINGGVLSLVNKQVSGAIHQFGTILFQGFRDVADPSYVASIRAEGTSPAGNTADMIFATGVNGGGANPAEAMRIRSDGKIGIGIAVPLTTLDVNGSITVRGNIGAPNSSSPYTLGTDPTFSNGGMLQVWGSTAAGTPNIINFWTSGIERMRILADGGIYDMTRSQRLGWANLPQSSPGDWNVGMVTYINANVSVIGGGASVGTTYIIFNTTAGNLTFFEVGGLNVWLGGTNTHGNRTIASHSLATLWYFGPNDAVMCGQGVS